MESHPHFLSPPKTIGTFFVRCLIWLPIAFFLWIVFAPVLHFPIAVVMVVLSWIGIPQWLLDVEQGAQTFQFITSLKPPSSEVGFNAVARVSTEVNGLLYSFGLPLFAALTMASGQPNKPRALASGYLMILPFLILAVYVTGLKQISVGAVPSVAAQMELSRFQNTLIAYVYQASTLIMPPVTAIAAWFLTHRRFVEGFTRGVFPETAVKRTSA